MRILVTGGAGYIGSHTVLQLLEAGHDVVVVDDLSNASPDALVRVAELTGREARLEVLSLLEEDRLAAVFAEVEPDAVVHFAGLKAVGESVAEPWRYYKVNVGGALALLRAMEDHGCRTLVFSSSATVYGVPSELPLTEGARLGATNPYGRTKLMIEDILRDVAAADEAWRFGILRYFNPVGAHESGWIGEHPQGRPNNLMPFLAQVAVGKRARLDVYGDDYDTPDGTGVRDYLHVVDLARGHLRALDRLGEVSGAHEWNLGTGHGTSVLELVRAFEAASGVEIPYEVVARRPGDVAASWADPAKANTELGWHAERTIDGMCTDTWRWQSQNPDGY